MPDCLLALGSNFGARADILDGAASAISRLPNTRLVRVGGRHETPAIGGPRDQNAFLNSACRIDTRLSPEDLLCKLNQIEADFGRTRSERWASRTLDIDVLLYDTVEMCTERISIPHPRMEYRRFVLEPANQVAPWMLHPTSQWTIGQLLQHLNRSESTVAVAAKNERTRDWLINQLSQEFADRRDCQEEPIAIQAWRSSVAGNSESKRGPTNRPGFRYSRPRLLIALLHVDVEQCDPDQPDSRNHDRNESLRSTAPATLFSSLNVRNRGTLGLPSTGPVAWIDDHDPTVALHAAKSAVLAAWQA